MTDTPLKKTLIKPAKDITKKSKLAEETLEQSERKYKALIDTTGTGYVILDSNGKVLDANPEYVRLTGHRSLDEIAGRSVVEWTAPHHRGRNIIEVNKCIEKGFVRNLEIDYIDQTGHITPIEINATLLKSNEVHHILTIVRDITERKKAEYDLHKSEERFRALIEHSHDAITLLTADGTVLYDSPSIVHVLGYSPTERIGRSVFEFVHPEERQNMSHGFAKFVQQPGAVGPSEACFLRKDGTLRQIEGIRTNLLHESTVRAVVVNYRDITERKNAEEILKEKDRELEIKAKNLEEANIALKVLLRRTDEDRAELEEKVSLNVRDLVMPYLEKLKSSSLDEIQGTFVNILESNLLQITSPFSHRVSSTFLNFSPKEIQVADLLRKGKTSKEIGELLNSSPRSITFHRENIRKKLGLKNRKANLKSYLLSLK